MTEPGFYAFHAQTDGEKLDYKPLYYPVVDSVAPRAPGRQVNPFHERLLLINTLLANGSIGDSGTDPVGFSIVCKEGDGSQYRDTGTCSLPMLIR